VRRGQVVLTERQFVQISPLTDSSHRRRRKPGYSGTGEIAVISARDLGKKSGRKRKTIDLSIGESLQAATPASPTLPEVQNTLE
ncbi:hypothetical protein PanWU01x14_235940, partial [Parasponia andersonii]